MLQKEGIPLFSPQTLSVQSGPKVPGFVCLRGCCYVGLLVCFWHSQNLNSEKWMLKYLERMVYSALQYSSDLSIIDDTIIDHLWHTSCITLIHVFVDIRAEGRQQYCIRISAPKHHKLHSLDILQYTKWCQYVIHNICTMA